jgi:hypothetical protein
MLPDQSTSEELTFGDVAAGYREKATPYYARLADLLDFLDQTYGAGYEFTVRELREDIAGDWTSAELRAKLQQLARDCCVYYAEGSWGLEYE